MLSRILPNASPCALATDTRMARGYVSQVLRGLRPCSERLRARLYLAGHLTADEVHRLGGSAVVDAVEAGTVDHDTAWALTGV